MKKYGLITHGRLSASHRISQKIPLRFTFHFYGHDVTNVTIATGGFLYMSDFLHRWLTATQYIAPLMANFDTSLRNESRVHYADNGTAFIVLWEDVHLHDDVAAGPFTFEVILHKDGTIIFSYYQIPKEVLSLSTFQHPVKVGLSDAYYMDEVFYSGGRRRTIFEYHRVKINMTLIASHTAVIITPLPTCNIYKNCSECLTASTNFKCMWCPAATRCSSGLDRKRQEWLQHRCHLVDLTVEQCPKSPVNFTTMSPVPDSPSTAGAKSRPSAVAAEHSGGAKPGVIIAVLLVVCLVCGIASWLLYAYLKPQSKSGLWLIEHRPSRVREQLRSVMFKKDTNSTDA
ncbi:hypothetical protein NP493_285g00010 [Ridgeia piscesae]|uniref:PSI domain-containing protein n=1 Tax=Ridgeia piscesae TaxID=27915 RepID=A0AAD9NX33_RIDPI|nr:hypothetical protein NP493_285g00010 [Ridgeia piscesae]